MSEAGRNPQPAEEEIEIDLHAILRILRKWSKMIISMTLFCTLLVGAMSWFVLSPVYQSNTLLMVTQATEKLQNTPSQSQQDQGLENVVSKVATIPVWTMNTYLSQLKSEALLQRIITQLGLTEEGYTPASLAGLISASIVKDTNLIEVRVSNGDPVLASRIANTLSNQYLAFMTEKNQAQMSRSMNFLDEQKKANDQALQVAVADLQRFQSQPGGVPILESEFNAQLQDKVKFNTELKTVAVEVEQLTQGVGSLERELATLPQTVNITQTGGSAAVEVNPLYVTVSQELAVKRASLAEKQGQYQSLSQLVASMDMNMDSMQAELAAKRLEQDRLQLEVDRLKKTSSTLADKSTETQIARSIDLGDTSVMVISEAAVPTVPVKPNKKMNTALAMVLSLVIFTMLAFVLEYLDNTLKTPEDIDRDLDMPVLGIIPRLNRSSSGHLA